MIHILSPTHLLTRTTTMENLKFKPKPFISLDSKPNRVKVRFKINCSSPNSNSNSKLETIIWAIPDWADNIKELGMQKRRTLYTPQDWRYHRSSRRHLRHVISSLSSRVILSLIPPVLSFTSFAALLAFYNTAVEAGWWWLPLPEWMPVLRASSLPYQLTAPALALLLVFRTEASYSRFVEGKRCWNRVLAALGEMAALVMQNPNDDEEVKKVVLGYIMAFPVALKCHVINGSDVRADLQNLLDKDDIELVMSSKHRPRCLIEFITQSLRMLNLEEPTRTIVESKLGCFHEGIGLCEQLMGIPIPLSYTRLTSRFLVFWHLTLPIILWDDCNWIVIPATFISAASLFCIEEVGVLIEEPFSMLALDELCKQLHESIQEALSLQKKIHVRLGAKMKKGRRINGWPNS